MVFRMKTPFPEIHGRIGKVRTHLETMDVNFARWASPHFDPMRIPDGPDFPRVSSTPDDLAERLLIHSPEDEVDCQLAMLGWCLEQMAVASRLIELQNAYNFKNGQDGNMDESDMDDVYKTIDADGQGYLHLAGDAVSLREALANSVYDALDEDSYRAQLHTLTEENEKAEAGHIRWSFQYATTVAQLAEYIFEDRLQALNTSLKSVERLTERIHFVLEDYAIIRISEDENIAPETADLRALEKGKADFCRRALRVAQHNLDLVEQFADRLIEMGSLENNHQDFVLTDYKPLSINTLPRFTP